MEKVVFIRHLTSGAYIIFIAVLPGQFFKLHNLSLYIYFSKDFIPVKCMTLFLVLG